MPDMSKPLAHLESLLDKVRFDIERATEATRDAQARLGVLQEYERHIRLCLKDEQAKRDGDGERS